MYLNTCFWINQFQLNKLPQCATLMTLGNKPTQVHKKKDKNKTFYATVLVIASFLKINCMLRYWYTYNFVVVGQWAPS